MKNLLYFIAMIFVVIWLIAFLAYHVTSGLIHILLVLAAISILLRIIQGRNN